MNKKIITDVDVRGKRCLVRCDFNVPQDPSGAITDLSRINGALPTIKYLVSNGARVILCSHLGRPKGKFDPKFSLKPVCDVLNQMLGGIVTMAADVIGPDADARVAALADGQVLLLENVRYHKQEEQNDPEFAGKLASYCDIYVNDAFGTAHRAHASTAGVAQFCQTNVAGFLIEKEIRIMGGALTAPERPFVAILGGAKVSDKIGVINNLINKVDALIIGGAMAYTFIRARGGSVGKSRVELDKLDLAKELMEKAAKHSVAIYLPVDNMIVTEFSADAQTRACPSDSIPDGYEGLDIGPASIEKFAQVISSARTVVWNGPMGVFEFARFATGTRAVAQALADNKNCVTIIGGGDSAAAVEQMGFGDRMTHISTGGGASLEFLEGIELPGIACLDDKAE